MSSGYQRLAETSIFISIVSVLFLVLSLPTIYDFADLERDLAVERSAKFRKSSDELWTKIFQLREGVPIGAINFFSRNRRSDWLNGGGFCKGCFTLACPMGVGGPPGQIGPDGNQGEAGKPGRAGDDGYDVQLETEQDMPCVVCPAGPPGPRGPQGERGLTGTAGYRGEPGPDASFGMGGPAGIPGIVGPAGRQGPVGAKGIDGDMSISGMGVKGPIGPAGPQGMKGRPGPPGKSSNSPGTPGLSGTIGAIGAIGKAGAYGMEGPYGPPGDPGMPASYCPSDCGVQNILADPFPAHGKAKMNEYSAPPASVSKTNSPSDYERRLRKKMIKKMLALKKYKQ